ncbi:MAG: ACT domain-containing protein, partial [Oscillospiraceae bacterium]|nr:ACT domain-containing protein [Oscillospiraceae bacterium]
SFTCAKAFAEDAVSILNDIFAMEGATVSCDTSIAKVSIVGAGMQSHSGTASKMFGALYEAGINISMISTSEITISVLIDKELADKAVAAIHAAFFG